MGGGGEEEDTAEKVRSETFLKVFKHEKQEIDFCTHISL